MAGGVLSALLALYNEDRIPSGASTPTSMRTLTEPERPAHSKKGDSSSESIPSSTATLGTPDAIGRSHNGLYKSGNLDATFTPSPIAEREDRCATPTTSSGIPRRKKWGATLKDLPYASSVLNLGRTISGKNTPYNDSGDESSDGNTASVEREKLRKRRKKAEHFVRVLVPYR